MSGSARTTVPVDGAGQVAGPDRRHVRRHRAALRPAQPAAERGHRPLLAQARDRLARRSPGARSWWTWRPARPTSRSKRALRAAAAPGPRASSGWTSPARCWRSASARCEAAGEERRIVLVQGDAMRLPVADRSADAVTIAFGIRNVHTASVACAEMARVLKPGGRLAILEFGVPRVPGLGWLYQWYFRAVLPRVGTAHLGAHGRLFVSAGVGRHVHAAGRVRAHAGAGGLHRGARRPFDDRHRLSLHGAPQVRRGARPGLRRYRKSL